jgi:hypothetical protein
MKSQVVPLTLSCILFSSCSILGAPNRSVTTLMGVQDGSNGDVSAAARPVLSISLEGDQNSVGLIGVFGVQLSAGEFGGLNEMDVTTDALSLGMTSGLRLSPGGWQQTFRPFLGAGLALEYLDIDLPSGAEDGFGLGGYAEAGFEYGAWSIHLRRVAGLSMDLGQGGDSDVRPGPVHDWLDLELLAGDGA